MSDQRHTGPGVQQDDERIQAGAGGGSSDVPDTTVATTSSNDALMGAEGTSHSGAGREVELSGRFENPGLPAHVYRRSDIDPKAAARREREVATFFGLSTLGTLLFIVAYFAVKPAGASGEDMLGQVGLSTRLLGLGLGLSLFFIGAGAIHWAKTLMPHDEIVAARKPMRSSTKTVPRR